MATALRAMRAIDLREYVRSEPVPLSVAERDSLRDIVPSLTIEPAPGMEDEFHLTSGSVIGAFESGGLSVSIRPKLTIARVLFLASYAMGAFKLREMERFDFAEASTLVEAMALALAAAARRAFAGGLVHGYRTEEEAAPHRPAAEFGSTSRSAAVSGCRFPSRCATMNSRTT